MTGNRGLTRQILGLAVPAFFALVAEPLFLLVDSAIVGHLGTPQLAGLGVAGSVLGTAAGVFVFLAYGTTASVARALGAGADDKVVAAGVDGTVLAIGLGTDPSFRAPMAIVVIGGLITSTLLSLLVVPAVFTYIDDLEHLLKRGMAKLRRQKAPLRRDDRAALEK